MTDITELEDSRGVAHKITSRNLRAYKGREFACGECSELTEINDLPLICHRCGGAPIELLVRPTDWWNQPALEGAHVLVIGCGAVGNEAVKGLVMLGVGRLTLIDFDRVEAHNLSRAVLFNHASMAAADSDFKVDVMKAGALALNPNVLIDARKAGVLDSITARKRGVEGEHGMTKEELAKRVGWPEVLEAEDLRLLASEVDLCIVATDGVAPKAMASMHLYPLIPMVQGAMNSSGSTVAVRVSLPQVTSCIMCPSELEAIGLDSSGLPTPYIREIRRATGMGGCDAFIEAAGAASFTDATSMVGAAMLGQAVLILMGWPSYVSSGHTKWPITAPLWDEVLSMAPRNPGVTSIFSTAVRRDGIGNPICAMQCYDNLWMNFPDAPRVLALDSGESGVPKPGSTRRPLGA